MKKLVVFYLLLARFSDNFFDLLPGEKNKIIITSPQISEGNPININIKHIRKTYK